jgi:protein associated with RNAse G/E
MDQVKVGEWFNIESYKHDGRLHRTWEGSKLLHSGLTYICGNNQIKVREADGREWVTREPAICTFYPYDWFNVVAMLRMDGIYYYCNIGSPAYWRNGILTYIDYDLDVKIYPDWSYEILDEEEFQENITKMSYPVQVVAKVREANHKLISMMQQRIGPFEAENIERWYAKFIE